MMLPDLYYSQLCFSSFNWLFILRFMEEANNLKPNKVVVAKCIWKEYSTGKKQ